MQIIAGRNDQMPIGSSPARRRCADPRSRRWSRRSARVCTNRAMFCSVRASVSGMPFIDHERGRAYYRHWAAAEPRAVVIFLHGFGEHTGVYHRYGFALNAAGIDLWAVDQFGHGLSPGTRGDFGSIEDSSALADSLTELAERERPGLPLIAAGPFVRLGRHPVPAARPTRPLPRRSHLRRPAGPDSRNARRGQLIRPRPRLAIRRPVLPGLAGERPAGVRRRRWRAAGAGARQGVGPVRLRPAQARRTHAGGAWRRRSDRADRSRCARTPSR